MITSMEKASQDIYGVPGTNALKNMSMSKIIKLLDTKVPAGYRNTVLLKISAM